MIWELLLIILVALLVINPKRLPEILYTLGVWMARLQRFKQSIVERYYGPL